MVARILLGIQFVVFGINGFAPFLPVPAHIPHAAVAFSEAMFTTHFSYLVFGVQLIAGLLILANRFVPLAVVLLGAVLANIFTFHITMWPSALFPMPIIALVLWLLVAWPIRGHFAGLFANKVRVR